MHLIRHLSGITTALRMKKAKQLQFKKIQGWGGKRANAGRKKTTGATNHMARPKMDPRWPVHITMRLKRGLKGLRSPRLHREFQQSLGKAKAQGLNALHYSLQGNHLHVAAECEDNRALSKGMNSFAARFGKTIRKKLGGKGKVFEGRYHVKVIKTARQMRNTIAYILLNESKHKKWEPDYDECSSARFFKDWTELLGRRDNKWFAEQRSDPLPDFMAKGKSWLATRGWRNSA